MAGLVRDQIYGVFKIATLEMAIEASALLEVVRFPQPLVSMPLAPPAIGGLFSLRGAVVPLLDMRALCADPRESRADDDSCVAIIRVDHSCLGLVFDSTSDVLRVHAGAVQAFSTTRTTERTAAPVRGAIVLDGGERLIQLLDAAALLSLPGVPRPVGDAGRAERGELRPPASRCITFHAEGNCYGFAIAAVNEIIPVVSLDATGLRGATCVGQIGLRGTAIPVLDLARLLMPQGGDPPSAQAPARVIIAAIDGQPVGFRVDEVGGIVEYSEEAIQVLPPFQDGRESLLRGCVVIDSAHSFSLIDHPALFAMEEVSAPAALYRSSNALAEQARREERAEGPVNTYLVIRLGIDVALPVAAISEVIECPQQLAAIAHAPHFVDGQFSLRERIVTVINMRALYRVPFADAPASSRLLIVEHGDCLLGLRVDGVNDIVKGYPAACYHTPSQLFHGWPAAASDIEQTMVSGQRVLPLLGLTKILSRAGLVLPAQRSLAA